MGRVIRTWGWYLTLLRVPLFCIKILCFERNKKLSYQKHLHRKEFWIFLKGEGFCIEDTQLKTSKRFWYIDKEVWHSFMSSVSKTYVLEVQWGRKVSEKDIVRKAW